MLIEPAAEFLVAQYFDRLALDWRRRPRLLASLAGFAALAAWDGRLHTYAQGLRRLDRSRVRTHLRARLNEPLSPGEVFAGALAAFLHDDPRLLETTLGLAQGLPSLWPALEAAVEWAPGDAALWPLLREARPALYLRGRVWREPLSADTLLACLRDEADQRARVTVLEAIAVHGDRHLARHGLHSLDHPQAAVRLAAAELALALIGGNQRPAALAVLQDLALGDDPLHTQATLSLAGADPGAADAVLESLAARPDRRRLYLQALGWAGRSGAVPVLAQTLDDPRHARIAAAALRLLTGSDPVADGWQGQPPAGARDPLPAPDPDAGLPWPDREGFSRWWQESDYDPRRLYLAGRVIDPPALAMLLRAGPLAWRPLAAWRLHCLSRGPRFPTLLPADHQQALFHRPLPEAVPEKESFPCPLPSMSTA